MPIVDRSPGPRPTAVPRSGDDGLIGSFAPPKALLPAGGAPPPASAPAPHRVLALDALRLMRSLRDRPRDAGSWGEPAFAREVDSIRRHLGPIRSRRALAASFGREAFHTRRATGPEEVMTLAPLRIAYALRWLELGDGLARPGWTGLVTGRD